MTSKEQLREEFALFLLSVEIEGGLINTLRERGTQVFPTNLKQSARKFQKALLDIEADIEEYSSSLGFRDQDEAIALGDSIG